MPTLSDTGSRGRSVPAESLSVPGSVFGEHVTTSATNSKTFVSSFDAGLPVDDADNRD